MDVRSRYSPSFLGLVIGACLLAACAAACQQVQEAAGGPKVAQEWIPEEHLDDIAGAAAVIDKRAAQQWPVEFRGVRINGNTIEVSFTADAEAKVAQLRREVDQPHRLVAVDATQVLEELQALQQQLIADRAALQAGSPPPGMPDEIVATSGEYDLDIAIEDSAVLVNVKQPSEELLAAFRAFYKTKAIVLEGGVAAPDSG